MSVRSRLIVRYQDGSAQEFSFAAGNYFRLAVRKAGMQENQAALTLTFGPRLVVLFNMRLIDRMEFRGAVEHG